MTNQTLFIYHYVKAESLVLWYNYTTRDSDPSLSNFVEHFGRVLDAYWTELCFCFFTGAEISAKQHTFSFLQTDREQAGEHTNLACSRPFHAPRSSSSSDDNNPARTAKITEWETLSRKAILVCCVFECDMIDTIHLLCRPLYAPTRDIFNWCQGPINHPVSKRPCNAFYISAYVESKRVCHQCKSLWRKKAFWRPFPV